MISVVDPHHVDADPDNIFPGMGCGFRFLIDTDPDADPDSTFHLDGDSGSGSRSWLPNKGSNLEKVLK
jgi:hypothetical protein